MDSVLLQVVTIVVAAAIIGAASLLAFRRAAASVARENEAARIRVQAEVELAQKTAIQATREEAQRIREDEEKRLRDQQEELRNRERKLEQREFQVDQKAQTLETKVAELKVKEDDLEKARIVVVELRDKHLTELERIAALTRDSAKDQLMARLEEELQREMALKIKQAEQDTREQAEKRAREIVTTAIQRTAVDHCVERTVSVVQLPSEEMKGRIIGREGRNIRALENATGIDLIIDDTPEAIILSSFDPVRREIARVALERLISDGRIHPARIEEQVEKARIEVDETIRSEGEKALLELGIAGVHPEVIKTLGRLRYRTSYGQNVLAHTKEVAHVCAAIASEIGANVAVAKRAALFHDLGKAVSHEQEGSHAVLGADIAQKYGERPEVVHAIKAHHYDVDPSSVEACLVLLSDAISAARPGARRENIDIYIKRLEKLEAIAKSFSGVDRVFAVQAGREVRLMVAPDVVDDVMAAKLARDIAKRIETEMEYPGMIKVTVIRETRNTEFAK
ncbi:MAG: ribonuclease Y [Candidatus Sericytochromatia bacterium]|uniref:Ribonuclease Y n=1 Tax=Candidatus Tanganyikabacteria bacterium TaxID=2961651 RepID=A0A937X1A4_9BACT|nr:ribonuclease Y [Candidatus Tanganyikabacteria bacterium]